MTDFLVTYRPHIIYAITVVVTVLVLRYVTGLLHRWLVSKTREKFPTQRPTSIDLIDRILNTLWFVLGIIALSFVFIGEDRYSIAVNNFKLALYLGSVAVLTIVAATTLNLWFSNEAGQRLRRHEDTTSLKFLRYVAVSLVYAVGALFALMAFPSLRGVAQTALGGAGVIAIIAGVASQEALANLVGGVFIITFKPFKIGDTIEVTSTMVGTVTDITLRHTVLRNFQNKMIVIPNSIINKERLINYDLGDRRCCELIEVGISYDSDVELAKQILGKVCTDHPLNIDTRTQSEKESGVPRVKTLLTKLNDSSVTIRASAWAQNFGDAFTLHCDVLATVKRRFQEQGIEIPFPHRTVQLKESAPAVDQ